MGSILDERDYRLAQLCDAMSNGVRLKLILLLRDDERYVKSLAEELNRHSTTISKQLSRLAHQDLVQSETRGRKNYYSLKKPKLIKEFLKLRRLLRREE